MKIYIKEVPKAKLLAGKHIVDIEKIEEGSTINGLEYFDCFFKNGHGVCSSRFYNTENGLYRIVSLFRGCNIPVASEEYLLTSFLVGLTLQIENISTIVDGNYVIETVAFYPFRYIIADDHDVF